MGSKDYVMRMAALFALVASLAAHAVEAPTDMHEFNVKCPASKLLPQLDAEFHECNKGFVNGSCENFVAIFEQLVPEYDCQRAFDFTPDKQYVVPAIWLAGDGAVEDYVVLLARMASGKDEMFNDRRFAEASASARALFGSQAFSYVLDGHLTEEYGPLAHELRTRPQK